jgi:hypothetical protein
MRLLFCILCLLLAACVGPKSQDAVSKFNEKVKEKPFTVVVTYSNECPVCILYTSVLKDLFQSLPKDSFQCILLKVNDSEKWDFFDSTFVNAEKSNISAIEKDALDVVKSVGLTMFPEVAILNAQGKIQYSGAIDNRVKDLSAMHFRPEKSDEFLKNALQQLREHKAVEISQTAAKGCYIEFPKKP